MTLFELIDMLKYDTGHTDIESTVFIEDDNSGTRHEIIGVGIDTEYGVRLHISNEIL